MSHEHKTEWELRTVKCHFGRNKVWVSHGAHVSNGFSFDTSNMKNEEPKVLLPMYLLRSVTTMDTITWKCVSQEISAVKVISFLKYAACALVDGENRRVWVDEKSVALDNHFVMSLLSFYSFTFIIGQFFVYFMCNSHRSVRSPTRITFKKIIFKITSPSYNKHFNHVV